jgi:KaiC/GvpD/RAD55 family RecA-like ATPase
MNGAKAKEAKKEEKEGKGAREAGKPQGRPSVSTGLAGLDKILGGGFESGALIEVSGGPGAGKTTFGLQFARAAIQAGGKTLYIAFEETGRSLQNTARAFGWDFGPQAVFAEIKPYKFKEAVAEILGLIEKHRPACVVLDTVTALSLYAYSPEWKCAPAAGTVLRLFTPSLADVRRALADLASDLRGTGATTLLLSESAASFRPLREVLDFICDGVICIHVSDLGTGTARLLEVRKMRRIPHSLDKFPLAIGKAGLSLAPLV